jgi:hypothetical protein
MSETVGQAVEQVSAPKMISPDTPALWGPEHEFERYRDVPLSCICSWSWGAPAYRWVLLSRKPGCPWHSAEVRDYR